MTLNQTDLFCQAKFFLLTYTYFYTPIATTTTILFSYLHFHQFLDSIFPCFSIGNIIIQAHHYFLITYISSPTYRYSTHRKRCGSILAANLRQRSHEKLLLEKSYFKHLSISSSRMFPWILPRYLIKSHFEGTLFGSCFKSI